MRVAIFNGDMSRGGGTERITQTLANLLVDNSTMEIYVINLNNESATSYFCLKQCVKFVVLRQNKILSKIIELRKFIIGEKIDVIINVDVMLGIYSIPATMFTGTKLIAWEMFNIRNDIGSKHTKWIRQYFLLFSDYYINQTKGDMNAFLSEMKVRCPITYIYNPCYSDDYSGYNKDSKIIVTAGHFFFTKGYDLAVEVARKVFKLHPDWCWHFYGDGSKFEQINQKIKDYGLEENVILCGRTQKIIEEFKKAAMYVMVSRTEGFGLVLTEAKSCNLPTIAFDCEFGPREIIEDGKSGYLISQFSIDEMTEKICNLIEDQEKRIQFSNHAKDNMNLFSQQKFIESWLVVLNSLKKG